MHTDHLNTPTALSQPSTNIVVWRWDRDPFGTTAPNPDPDANGLTLTFNQRFPGQTAFAESGLNYNYFRDYDPQTGRYVESDPIGLDGGVNTYGYDGARPTMLSDPYGLEAIPFPNTTQGVRVCVVFPELCAAGAAGVGGYAIGTLAYPNIERPLSKAIDAICRSGPTPEECEKEWAEALRICRKLIMEQLEQAAGRRKRRSVTGVTGGYTDLQKCAAGLVSEACGGNKVDHGKR